MADSTTVSLLSATLRVAMTVMTVMMVTTTLNARSQSGGTHVAQPLAVSQTLRVLTTTSRSRIPGANGGVTMVSFASKLNQMVKVSVACISILNPSMPYTQIDKLYQNPHE